MLKSLARGMKDGAIALALKAYVNDRLSAFGEITDCAVDTRKSRLTLKVMLKGERESVTATIERYELEVENGDRYIVLKEFSSSRTWLTLLLTKLLADKRYRLPAAISSLL
jgi:hypothetical protein